MAVISISATAASQHLHLELARLMVVDEQRQLENREPTTPDEVRACELIAALSPAAIIDVWEPEPDAPVQMHLYKFSFERNYVEREGFERIIRAPSLPEAEAAAERLAAEFNMDCPDDCSDTGRGSGGAGFEAECVSAEVHKASEPDYVVLPDGQCVPYET